MQIQTLIGPSVSCKFLGRLSYVSSWINGKYDRSAESPVAAGLRYACVVCNFIVDRIINTALLSDIESFNPDITRSINDLTGADDVASAPSKYD